MFLSGKGVHQCLGPVDLSLRVEAVEDAGKVVAQRSYLINGLVDPLVKRAPDPSGALRAWRPPAPWPHRLHRQAPAVQRDKSRAPRPPTHRWVERAPNVDVELLKDLGAQGAGAALPEVDQGLRRLLRAYLRRSNRRRLGKRPFLLRRRPRDSTRRPAFPLTASSSARPSGTASREPRTRSEVRCHLTISSPSMSGACGRQ